MADASLHSLYFATETTYGSLATTGYKTARITGCTLAMNRETILSEELRADRQIVGHVLGAKTVGGDISTELTYDSDLKELIAAAIWADNSTTTLKAAAVRTPYSFVRLFGGATDAGGDLFTTYSGCEFSSMNLSTGANDKVSVSFSIMGVRSTAVATAPAGISTASAPQAGKMMAGSTGAIFVGGSSAGCITEVNFTVENGMENQFCIGSTEARRPSIGRANITGNITAHFTSLNLLNLFINGTETSASYIFEDQENNVVEFNFPAIKFTGGNTDVSGAGSVTLVLPFQAVYNSTQGTALVVKYY